MKAVKNPNEAIRLAVIEALSEMGPDASAAVQALTDATADTDPAVREAAVLALFSVGEPAASSVPKLAERLGDQSGRVQVHGCSCDGQDGQGFAAHANCRTKNG